MPAMPPTVPQLYMLGMQEHDRPVVLQGCPSVVPEPVPHWRFDRTVIRLGLYFQERLRVAAGERLALLGPFNSSWLAADFATLSLGAVAVGIDPALPDVELVSVLHEARVRVAVATDAEAAGRLLQRGGDLPGLETVVAPAAPLDGPPLLLWDKVLDLGGTLDTPERARRFRAAAAAVAPEAEAFWAVAPSARDPGRLRLTHAELMAHVRARLLDSPARTGDVAYSDTAPGAAARVAGYGFVGDGSTLLWLGCGDDAHDHLPELRPHRLIASSARLAEIERDLVGAAGHRRPSPLRRWWPSSWPRRSPFDATLRRAVERRLGDRVRWLAVPAAPAERCEGLLQAAGVTVARGPAARSLPAP